MTVKVEISKEQILAALQKLPQGEREMLTYQLRKEEGLKKLMKLREEIQAEMKPGDEMSMDEIVAIVHEIRKERYEEKKKKQAG